MFKIFKLLLAFFLIQTIKTISDSKSNDLGSNCLIHNKKFSYEYLHAWNDNDTWIREKKKTDLISFGRINDFTNLRWSLIETTNGSGHYYIKNKNFEDCLCASSKFSDIFHLRRVVMRLKINTNYNLLDYCKWKIVISPNSKTSIRSFSIVNVFYDEPLYAVSYYFRKIPLKREIFLWHKKEFNSNKFNWIIDCKKRDYF